MFYFTFTWGGCGGGLNKSNSVRFFGYVQEFELWSYISLFFHLRHIIVDTTDFYKDKIE